MNQVGQTGFGFLKDMKPDTVSLADRFLVPPFTLLDTRAGYWQDRRSQWLALGIESEIGREAKAYSINDGAQKKYDYLPDIATGTSIFDPVLCELAYRWFCPKGGTILDPFAGGSVRGIVAGRLGYGYTGIDLSARQVQANRLQATTILGHQGAAAPAGVLVKVSTQWARHLFQCNEGYITSTCKGRCCQGTDRILVSLTPDEARVETELGHTVWQGLLEADTKTGRCPYKQSSGLCSLHGTGGKFLGCVVSPFTINASGTVIIRHRYSQMACHGSGSPAYKVFAESLTAMFGEEEAQRITGLLDDGAEGMIDATMPAQTYDTLLGLDGLKHSDDLSRLPSADPSGANPHSVGWTVGDARNTDDFAAGQYDMIFTCPPYYNLEVYSDDPADLSACKSYGEFLTAYMMVIAKCITKLKLNRFAVFVVGNVRDKAGFFYDLAGDTVKAFAACNVKLYNEAILLNSAGSLPIRITKQFNAGRKMGKCHQNVLVFYKGDPKRIKDIFGESMVSEYASEYIDG